MHTAYVSRSNIGQSLPRFFRSGAGGGLGGLHDNGGRRLAWAAATHFLFVRHVLQCMKPNHAGVI